MYVIGGLVDRTVQKGASLGVARALGAAAARLPIAETLGPGAVAKGKGVLNVNDVFAALLAVHAGGTWTEALEAAIPARFRGGGRPAPAPKPGKQAAPAAAAQQQQVEQQAEQQQAEQQAQQQQQQQAQQQQEEDEAAPAAEEEDVQPAAKRQAIAAEQLSDAAAEQQQPDERDARLPANGVLS